MHDPKRADSPAARRARTGLTAARRAKKRAPPPMEQDELPCGGRLETLEDCAKWAAWIAVQTLLGRIDDKQAREVTKTVNMLRLQLKDDRAADKRLKELQRRLAEVKAPQ